MCPGPQKRFQNRGVFRINQRTTCEKDISSSPPEFILVIKLTYQNLFRIFFRLPDGWWGGKALGVAVVIEAGAKETRHADGWHMLIIEKLMPCEATICWITFERI